MAESFLGGVGVDRRTGKMLVGWAHLKQSIGVIFTTAYGERVMREWFGSAVPHMLGENMVESTFHRSFMAMAVAIDLWEPRARIASIEPISVDGTGAAAFRMEVEYRPRGHLGDFTVADVKRVIATGAPESVWRIEDA